MISASQDGANVASLSELTNFLTDNEKSMKPNLTRIETIQQLCYMSDERTRLTLEAIKTGSGKSIKKTDVAGKQRFNHIMEAKVMDSLYEKEGTLQDDIFFATRYFKAD